MGLKTQTSDAAQKIHNRTFLGEGVDEPSQASFVAGVKSDCVSPSAPTRQRRDCVLLEAAASLCVAAPPRRPPGHRSPKVATFPRGSANGSGPHTRARAWLCADTSANGSSRGRGSLVRGTRGTASSSPPASTCASRRNFWP